MPELFKFIKEFYLNNKEGINESLMEFTNRFNHCKRCNESRLTVKKYLEEYNIKVFKKYSKSPYEINCEYNELLGIFRKYNWLDIDEFEDEEDMEVVNDENILFRELIKDINFDNFNEINRLNDEVNKFKSLLNKTADNTYVDETGAAYPAA